MFKIELNFANFILSPKEKRRTPTFFYLLILSTKSTHCGFSDNLVWKSIDTHTVRIEKTRYFTPLSFRTGSGRSWILQAINTFAKKGVVKGSEKKGTTKSTKKSFSFVVQENCHGDTETRRREKSFSSVSPWLNLAWQRLTNHRHEHLCSSWFHL